MSEPTGFSFDAKSFIDAFQKQADTKRQAGGKVEEATPEGIKKAISKLASIEVTDQTRGMIEGLVAQFRTEINNLEGDPKMREVQEELEGWVDTLQAKLDE